MWERHKPQAYLSTKKKLSNQGKEDTAEQEMSHSAAPWELAEEDKPRGISIFTGA